MKIRYFTLVTLSLISLLTIILSIKTIMGSAGDGYLWFFLAAPILLIIGILRILVSIKIKGKLFYKIHDFINIILVISAAGISLNSQGTQVGIFFTIISFILTLGLMIYGIIEFK